MATVTLSPDPQKFLPGTAVSLYLRTDDSFEPGGTAQGNSPQTVAADGTVSFSGLTSGQGYWLADAGGDHVAVFADVEGTTPIDTTGDLDVVGALTATTLETSGGIGVHGSTAGAQAAAIATPASPGASYVQAEVVALRTALAAVLVALRNTGIIDT